jgi:hypothetical protein
MKGPNRIGALFFCVAGSLALSPAEAGVVTDWNALTLNCVQGQPPIPANRAGPPGLLDVALVQAAVHDAIQAIEGRFEPYQYDNAARRGSGTAAAAAAAATYDVLAGLYTPADPCLVGVPNPTVTYAGDPGLLAGAEAAAALLQLHRPAFTLPTDPFVGGTGPGEWRPTPGVTAAANTWMAQTAPFVLDRASQFRPQPPPPLTSQAYLRDYEEVRLLGSATNSARSAEQTDLARFWDGNPIHMWFGALRSVADTLAQPGDQARLLALASLAAADSQIAVYDTKAHYNFWRPITAIREGDNDGNPGTVGVPDWSPLAVTPPYSDHSSGANNLSGSITTILRLFHGTDDVHFSISSPVGGLLQNPRHYDRFSDAADDVVDVRVLQGIHFRYADELGRLQGSRIGHWVFHKVLGPAPGAK